MLEVDAEAEADAELEAPVPVSASAKPGEPKPMASMTVPRNTPMAPSTVLRVRVRLNTFIFLSHEIDKVLAEDTPPVGGGVKL